MKILCFEVSYVGFSSKNAELKKQIIEKWGETFSLAECIKLYKKTTNLSLMECKNKVERILGNRIG
jgi:ribosomal protein L7/L12